MYRVGLKTQKELLRLPETGVGYQIVFITQTNNIKKKYIIINATYAIALDKNNNNIHFDIDETNNNILTDILKIELAGKKKILKAACINKLEKKPVCFGANEANAEYTMNGELFIRFSPFEDDIRIDKVNNRILPGSYATTVSDGEYCMNTGINIIERYALPSNKEIRYAFYINPLRDTPIKRGIVQPAYGKKGGGEEVIFPNGTTNNTVGKVLKL